MNLTQSDIDNILTKIEEFQEACKDAGYFEWGLAQNLIYEIRDTLRDK